MKAGSERQERQDQRVLSGKALLEDMEQYRREVTATPEAARAALRRIGVLGKNGKLRRLISG
ncbi:MAG: hypothetical protein RBT55_04355 [Rhodocyclaceae bacterium]|nr:hypothetical protein [Rhodocyclaceae bacterium]